MQKTKEGKNYNLKTNLFYQKKKKFQYVAGFDKKEPSYLLLFNLLWFLRYAYSVAKLSETLCVRFAILFNYSSIIIK